MGRTHGRWVGHTIYGNHPLDSNTHIDIDLRRHYLFVPLGTDHQAGLRAGDLKSTTSQNPSESLDSNK